MCGGVTGEHLDLHAWISRIQSSLEKELQVHVAGSRSSIPQKPPWPSTAGPRHPIGLGRSGGWGQ